MMRQPLRRMGLILGLLALLWSSASRAQESRPKAEGPVEKVGEKVGETIDRAARKIRQGAQDVGAGVEAAFLKVKSEVSHMGVEARVFGRLHWDKQLHHANLRLHVKKAGVVVLRGTVPSEEARSKAVALTVDTVGVEEVIDELQVTPSSTEPITTTTGGLKPDTPPRRR